MIPIRKIKRSTLIVVLSVIVLTLVTMNTTYSYVFSVKSATSVQTFTAGTLVVSVTSSKKMTADTLMPATSSDYPTSATSTPKSDNNNSYATLNLNNTGSLNAAFSVSISNDSIPSGKTAIDLQYLKIGIYDEKNSQWLNFGGSTYYTTLSSLSGTNGAYTIINDTVASSTNRNYKIYIWLSESTPTTEIGKAVYLKLNVKSNVAS